MNQIVDSTKQENSTDTTSNGNPGGAIATVDVPGIGAVQETKLGVNHFNVDHFAGQMNNASSNVAKTGQDMFNKHKTGIQTALTNLQKQ